MILVDIKASAVVTRINTDRHADVFHSNDTIYALNVTKQCFEIIRKAANEWTVTKTIALQIEVIHVSATMVVTPSSVYICNHNNNVYQYSFNGELLQTVTIIEHQLANFARMICAVDVDGRMALKAGDQLVIQHRHGSRVVKLEGVNDFYDIVFEDQHSVWILNIVNIKKGRYDLLKLVV